MDAWAEGLESLKSQGESEVQGTEVSGVGYETFHLGLNFSSLIGS